MAETQDLSFGALLRRLRTEANFTQEDLAERAQLSVRGLSDLERGANLKPRPFTLRQLADALNLDHIDRARLERVAARGSTTSSTDVFPSGKLLGTIPDGTLVARKDEMKRIASILDAVTEGSSHLLLVEGGPGYGKTRLLQELTVLARQRGFVELTAVCYPSGQVVPYYPLLQAFSSLSSRVPVSGRKAAERGWRSIQRLAETSELNPTVPTGAIQLKITSRISETLHQASRVAPLVLILDDVHWADDDSLKLIHELARLTANSRILLVGAFVDENLAENHPRFSEVLRLLTHDRLAECLAVRKLSPEETTTLMASLMGQENVSEEFAGFVYRRTKGKPRLIESMVWSLGGRLELQCEIGAGSTGRVFRAFDRQTDRVVAAKLVLAREGIEVHDLLRFHHEGRVLASLHHPNIVQVYDTFAEEHAACIIMELLDGRSLGDVLQEGPIPTPRARHIGMQVASALSYAHSRSIVHRDVKPDNVMILDDNTVKVMDFGIARVLLADNPLGTVATTGMRAGTPSYMAPEQIAGNPTDGRADVYALGAMLFHMVTGRPPFEGDDKLLLL